jgi:hypothetical protein
VSATTCSDDPARIAVLATPLERSLRQLEQHIAAFPPKLRAWIGWTGIARDARTQEL